MTIFYSNQYVQRNPVSANCSKAGWKVLASLCLTMAAMQASLMMRTLNQSSSSLPKTKASSSTSSHGTVLPGPRLHVLLLLTDCVLAGANSPHSQYGAVSHWKLKGSQSSASLVSFFGITYHAGSPPSQL